MSTGFRCAEECRLARDLCARGWEMLDRSGNGHLRFRCRVAQRRVGDEDCRYERICEDCGLVENGFLEDGKWRRADGLTPKLTKSHRDVGVIDAINLRLPPDIDPQNFRPGRLDA